eukprot:gene3504-2455_t
MFVGGCSLVCDCGCGVVFDFLQFGNVHVGLVVIAMMMRLFVLECLICFSAYTCSMCYGALSYLSLGFGCSLGVVGRAYGYVLQCIKALTFGAYSSLYFNQVILLCYCLNDCRCALLQLMAAYLIICGIVLGYRLLEIDLFFIVYLCNGHCEVMFACLKFPCRLWNCFG